MKQILRHERAYRASKQWKELRKLVYADRGYKCEACGGTNKLHVHHKTYENFGNESIDELELLCSSCHRKRHHDVLKDAELRLNRKYNSRLSKAVRLQRSAFLIRLLT
jgi:5-methylcytosine-specific restriction endonuclease McrA